MRTVEYLSASASLNVGIWSAKGLLFRLWLWSVVGGALVNGQEATLNYPETRRDARIDSYHGTPVPDPYRWLEDLDSDETARWVASQNEVTGAFLGRIPERAAIRERLTKLWNHERFGLPVKRGARYFFTRNDGLQNQSVLYVADDLHGEPRVLIDPNGLSADGTVALVGWSPSEDGRLLAYGLATAGSDWHEWRIRDVTGGQDLPDHLQWVKFSGVSWLRDGSGLFYSRYDEPRPDQQFVGTNYYQKLFLHRLGDPQQKDRLIYERRDEKEWGFAGHVTEDGRYLMITVWRGTERKNQVFYKDLQAEPSWVTELVTGFDAQYDFLGNDGRRCWVLTDSDAPLRRVIEINLDQPDRAQWRTIIPEADAVLEGVGLVGDRFFASYLRDAAAQVKVFGLDGAPRGEVALPGIGSAGGFGGRRQDRETFYSYSSFTTPGTIYRYDIDTESSRVFRQPRVDFEPDQFETRQVFAASRDGTRVPIFLTHRKGLPLNGDAPTVLYGYGGFDVSVTPSFSVSNVVWLERGGVYAVANLRGGGEYGRHWHEAGMKDRKQNVFDDGIAAAEWLIANRYTSPARLAIRGGSNGGLLVGACMTQRPDLFAAAVPAVGVMDMLRYHKFTIGWAWISEYGSADHPAEFQVLRRYSPLHNLRPGTRYPATLVTTADHDDRVVPAHSFKFAAALQHVQSPDRPALIRIETRAGHGAGKPTAKLIDEATDVLSFLVDTLNARQP